MHNRLVSQALCLGLAAQAACLAPEITADTNRDGKVDEGDRTSSKSSWTPAEGAIFLPNIGDKHRRCAARDGAGNPPSNDELAYCSDASGHLLLAPELAAPLRTAPMPPQLLSKDAVGRVYATPRAAYERTRLFYLEDAARPNATASWRLVDQELTFNASQLAAGLTLAIDGRELVEDPAVWDGTVLVRFEVTDQTNNNNSSNSQHSAQDAVALKMAPVLTHHHLQRVETFLSTAGNDSNPVQAEFVRQLDTARRSAAIAAPLLLFNQSDDIWAQDFLEPAYASMPGPQGPVAIRIMLRSAQSTRTAGRQVFEQLRGPGIGGYQPTSGAGSGFGHREINSYGNLETMPPYTSRNGTRYPAGRTIMGKQFDRQPAIVSFLEAQAVQSPLVLETGWMVIGHVDEFVQFLPFNNSLGFTVAIADTHSAMDVLQSVRAAGGGGTRAISFNGTTAGGDDSFPVVGVGMTVDELLANATFVEVNAYAQRYIDTNLETLLAELPLDRADVIRVPTLLHASEPFGGGGNAGDDGLPSHSEMVRAGEYLTASFWPASINGVVAGRHYITPRPWGPVVGGVDVLARAVEAAYARAGMTLSYVDDFLSHHAGFGDVHCGSNTFRQTDVAWWKCVAHF